MGEKKRLTWFILVRVVVVSLFLLSTIILKLKEPDTFGDQALINLTRLIIGTYLFSIASLLVIKFTVRYSTLLTSLQIIWDLLFVTLLLLITGGIISPYSFLYLLSIINASVLLSRREALYTASLCSILYGAIVDLQFYGILHPIGLSPYLAQQYDAHYIFYTIFVNIIAFYLTAFLTGYLAEKARRSESALQEKVIDFEELETLNSSIVANLNSGLLTINEEMKIRVFNRYAELLTRVTQEEAYDRHLFDIIPGFTSFDGELFNVRRGEVEYRQEGGARLVLGFNSVPINDKTGNFLGVIINFQDLTELKRLENELKRADRLAAVGKLSASIAHEIRNPLASISGSVQLLSQSEGVDDKDRKLFDIVLRETERMNELISDFLIYARPSPPVKVELNLRQLVVDLCKLLASDTRFDRIEIVNQCPEELSLPADPDQFRQVLWNLLVNAADALAGEGRIEIAASRESRKRPSWDARETVVLLVRDYGAGMDPDSVKRVFEPFFTTKSAGTGLGLATVYRIIEAHGGRIRVDSTQGEGTVFTIYLPADTTEREVKMRANPWK